MQVYIMRHGQAFTSGLADALRELTTEGKQEASKMANWIADNKIELDHIIASPYVRTQQTTKELCNNLKQEIPITTLDLITPIGSAQEAHDYIDGVCADNKLDNLLIVTHMPLVSYLVAELTVSGECPIFQTAAIAHIDYNPSMMKGELISLTSPDDL